MKRSRIKPVYIMTNDPSMTAWGWAVVDQWGKVAATGAIKTEPKSKVLRIRKGDDNTRRIREINTELFRVIKKYDVQYLLSELNDGGSQSSVAAFMLGAAVSCMDTISQCTGIGIEWYNEGDAKMSISGKKSLGSKDKMVKLVSKHYDVIWQNVKWIDQGVADALAVHHVAMEQSSMLKFLSR